MSLNFKYTNINSSTKVLLTREQIDFVLIPVQITLQQPEEVVQPSDTGPIMESTASTSTNVVNVAEDLLQSTLENPLGNIITNNTIVVEDPTGRTRGITAQQLTLEVIRDFENRTYGSNGTTTGGGRTVAGGEVVGTKFAGTISPRGRYIPERYGDGTETDADSFPEGTRRGRA